MYSNFYKSSLVLAMVFIALFFIGCSVKDKKQILAPFEGSWKGEVHNSRLGTLDMILDIYIDSKTQVVLMSSEIFQFHYMPVDWKIEDGRLILSMNSEEHRAIVNLGVSDEETLTGTHTQYGEENTITLEQISEHGKNGTFSVDYPEYSYEERFTFLKEYSQYAEDDIVIPYTYDLGNREGYEALIEEYGLDQLTDGLKDIDLALALLNWVCDNFRHNGNSGLPNDRDAVSLIDFYKKESDGINCRGLSIILSELLRVYQIPAKHITCMPKEPKFSDCHVVVHAYSEELDQWIMLDPTYRLVLKDEGGNYVNLSMLRDMLINEVEVIPNEDAGWNGTTFNVKDYREYMTKNTFRFQCATDFYFGAEEGYKNNIANMLIPAGYNEDKAERTTTDDAMFWIKPEP